MCLRVSADQQAGHASSCRAPRGKGRWIGEAETEGIGCKVQSAPKFITFESPQALRASIPTLFGPSGHFPLIGGIGPLSPRGAFRAPQNRRRGGRLCPPAGSTDFTKTFGEHVCTFQLVCRGRCPHRPGRMRRFYGNLRRIRNCPKGRQSRRPLQETVCIPPMPALSGFAENTCSVHRRRSVV